MCIENSMHIRICDGFNTGTQWVREREWKRKHSAKCAFACSSHSELPLDDVCVCECVHYRANTHTHPISHAYVDEYRYKCKFIQLKTTKAGRLLAFNWNKNLRKQCKFRHIQTCARVWVNVWQTYPYREDWLSATMIMHWLVHIMPWYMVNYRISISFLNCFSTLATTKCEFFFVWHRILFCINIESNLSIIFSKCGCTCWLFL